MDALVAAAIHDAKNQLSALGVWLGEAQSEFAALTPAASPALGRALAITTTLSAQLVELLALFRAGEGTLRLAVEDHYLEDFLADLMAELEQSRPSDAHAEETGGSAAAITIVRDFAATTTVSTWAFDAYLVKFALLDALRNALRKARSQVRVSLATDPGGGIRFDVEDDGPGYPAAVLDNAGGGGMSADSSGLGLTFARLIASRHATPSGQYGQLRLANDALAAGGARFSLILP